MRKIVEIVAVTHRDEPGKPSRLIDDFGDTIFADAILPTITNETIIVVEGAYMPVIQTSDDDLYQVHLGDICPSLKSSGKKPRIIYNEFMFQIPQVKLERMMTKTNMFQEACLEFIRLDHHMIPSRLTEFTEALKKEDLYIVNRKPPQSLVDLAKTARLINAKRNKMYMEAIERAMKLSDHVLFISGLVHALDIHIKQGWPIRFLIDENHKVRSPYVLFLATLMYNHFPQAIINYQ